MLGLSLEQWQLNEIDCDHRMVRDKLASALSLWLCTKKGASWMDIVYALRGVEEEVLASNIEAKYCQSGPGRPLATSYLLRLIMTISYTVLPRCYAPPFCDLLPGKRGGA